MIRRLIFTFGMLAIAPWWIFKAGLFSVIGVMTIVCSAIRKEWRS